MIHRLASARSAPSSTSVALASPDDEPDIAGLAGTLVDIAAGLEAIALVETECPRPETDDCCSTVEEAHEHGSEIGWWHAMAHFRDALGGRL